ncbi:hypothetical protein FJ976_19150 [Mesorhizobium sp. B1-1-9]|uniref:hypothetical protein n=1 Tax=Mesorhizobium sp. B1-1-9 TaxID=2589975 RepID=UPI00112EA31C|nr:hypothetical protein [Mesorhizobium sp. B1-1-9]TPN48520.1 hypothetical protein FJ976_19150 [Mesorhizobium sp. B1-1-9]
MPKALHLIDAEGVSLERVPEAMNEKLFDSPVYVKDGSLVVRQIQSIGFSRLNAARFFSIDANARLGLTYRTLE